MKVDMHLHTIRSVDGLITRKDVEKAIDKGIIDAIAITDHNTVGGWTDFNGINVIQGIEKTIVEDDGNEFHLLIYFANEDIPSRNFFEVVDAARQQDAIISIAHPFDVLRKAPRNITDYIKHIHGLECFNSRERVPNANKKALEFAKKNNLLMTAGSDAHTALEIGNAYVECVASDLEEFRKKLTKKDVNIKGKKAGISVHILSVLRSLKLIAPPKI